MNRIINIDFREEPPPVEIQPVTIHKNTADGHAAQRRTFWLTWQLFRSR